MTNTIILKRKIGGSGLKKTFLALSCGVTMRTFNNKLNGRTKFNQNEIIVLKKLLNLSDSEIIEIFFEEEVDGLSTGRGQNGN